MYDLGLFLIGRILILINIRVFLSLLLRCLILFFNIEHMLEPNGYLILQKESEHWDWKGVEERNF